jgi:prolyl oligopeptidase
MKRRLLTVFILVTGSILFGQKANDYPIAPKDSTFNVYFDTTIYDPYQWMENPLDPRLSDWIEAQKKISKKEASKHTKMATLKEQIASMYVDANKKTVKDYVKNKEKKSEYQFEFIIKDLDRTPDLYYYKTGSLVSKCLVRTKKFRKDKNDNVIITDTCINTSLDLIAIEMAHNGSDWQEVYFFDLESGAQLTDSLQYLRTGSQIIWYEDGVYYDRYNKPVAGRELLDKPTGQALYYHKIGTSQNDDLLQYKNPDTTGTNLFIYQQAGKNRIYLYHFHQSKGKTYKALSYATLNKEHAFFLKNFLLYPNSDSVSFIVKEQFGDTVILETNWEAPNGKLMKANINLTNKLEKLVPELDIPLHKVNQLGENRIACTYLNEGQYTVLIFNLKGELLKNIPFPKGKTVRYFYEKDPDAEYTDFCVSSFYHPDLWYQLSLKDLTFKPSESVWVPFDAEELETRYIRYPSKDGTMIPMYITCLKKTELNGNNPTLLNGYGGYGISIEPSFDQSMGLWLLHGGILAIPNIRGGGELGSDWSAAGRGLKKQNTFDDFIAAAEYLIHEKYTNPEKLAIRGGSHGGLLVGVAITQRPELFKAAIAEAGVFDMLRFGKYTIGSSGTSFNEFGDIRDSIDFCNMKSYSPLHHITKGTEYPNVLLITGDSDDRVPPFHSFKFLATLQEYGSPKSLYQLYLIPGAGHSSALTNEDWLNKLLFEYYFLFDELKLIFW